MKVVVIEIKKVSLKEYLDKIKPFSRDIIINLKKSDAWKIQLAIALKFIISKDVDGDHEVHSNSNNLEYMSYDTASKVRNELLSYSFQDTKLV